MVEKSKVDKVAEQKKFIDVVSVELEQLASEYSGVEFSLDDEQLIKQIDVIKKEVLEELNMEDVIVEIIPGGVSGEYLGFTYKFKYLPIK